MAGIVFGDAQYDPADRVFRFDASADGRTLSCVISVFAVEEIAGQVSDPAKPLDAFNECQHQIYDLVKQKYERYHCRPKGVLNLTILDVVCNRLHE